MSIFYFPLLVCGGLRGGMHAMLRYFVNPSRGRFLMEPKKLIQWARAISNRVRFLNRLRDVSISQNHRFAKLLA